MTALIIAPSHACKSKHKIPRERKIAGLWTTLGGAEKLLLHDEPINESINNEETLVTKKIET